MGVSCRLQADVCAARITLPRDQSLALARSDAGQFSFNVKGALAMLYKRNPQLNKNGELIHLLSTEGLPKDILTQVLDTAANFVSGRPPRGQESAAAARQECFQPVF